MVGILISVDSSRVSDGRGRGAREDDRGDAADDADGVSCATRGCACCGKWLLLLRTLMLILLLLYGGGRS
jgi:hypothetical protein